MLEKTILTFSHRPLLVKVVNQVDLIKLFGVNLLTRTSKLEYFTAILQLEFFL
jgi:hypothetical protein